jgi:hypothetical protein
MEGMGGLEQLARGTLAGRSPLQSHAELRWRLTKEFRLDLTKEMPHLESHETPLLGKRGRVYVGIFAIFVKDRW